MDMVEKVTEALRAAVAGKDYVWHDSNPGDRSVAIDGVVDIRDLARAAIAALREPTPEMVEAGGETRPCSWREDVGRDDEAAETAYQAMIDAALEEKAE